MRISILIMICLTLVTIGCTSKFSYYPTPSPEKSSKLKIINSGKISVSVQPYSEAENCKGPLLAFHNKSNTQSIPPMNEVEYMINGEEDISLFTAASNKKKLCFVNIGFSPKKNKEYILDLKFSYKGEQGKKKCGISMSIYEAGSTKTVPLQYKIPKIPSDSNGERCE